MIRIDLVAVSLGRLVGSVEKVSCTSRRRAVRDRLFYLVAGALNFGSRAPDFGPGHLNGRAYPWNDFVPEDLARLRLHARIGGCAFRRHPQCAPEKRHTASDPRRGFHRQGRRLTGRPPPGRRRSHRLRRRPNCCRNRRRPGFRHSHRPRHRANRASSSCR